MNWKDEAMTEEWEQVLRQKLSGREIQIFHDTFRERIRENLIAGRQLDLWQMMYLWGKTFPEEHFPLLNLDAFGPRPKVQLKLWDDV